MDQTWMNISISQLPMSADYVAGMQAKEAQIPAPASIFSNSYSYKDADAIFNAWCLSYSATQTAAMPIPVPTHILVTPTFWPVLRSSYSKVLTWRAPVQPSG